MLVKGLGLVRTGVLYDFAAPHTDDPYHIRYRYASPIGHLRPNVHGGMSRDDWFYVKYEQLCISCLRAWFRFFRSLLSPTC
jgi:hypothetical protein